MGLHKTKQFLHSNGNSHYTEDTVYGMGKIFSNYISDVELITRIYREPKNLISQRINNLLNKWTGELNRQFSKEEVQRFKDGS
jgi:hypothetical protein